MTRFRSCERPATRYQMRILITAGGTREYIDPVRFITNASSGKMGYALALAALVAGHRVTLISTIKNSKLRTQNSKLKIVNVETAAQMFDAVKKYFTKCDCLIMAAAVSDYTPSRPAKTKIKKSNKSMTIKLKPTVDILKWAGNHKKKNQIVIGFALEDKNLRENAEIKMRGKNLDMIVANPLAAIGCDKTDAQIKTLRTAWLKLPHTGKTRLARKIISLIEKAR